MPAENPFGNLTDLFSQFEGKVKDRMSGLGDPSFLDHLSVDGKDSTSYYYQIANAFFFHKLSEDNPCYVVKIQDKNLRSGQEAEAVKQILDLIESEGLTLVLKNIIDTKDWIGDGDEYSNVERTCSSFMSEDSVLNLRIDRIRNYTTIAISLLTTDESRGKRIHRGVESHCEENPDSANLYVVTQSLDGLDLTSIGRPAAKFIEDNYETAVIDDFKYIVSQLKSPNPNGRLTIIHGEPGTGKTYFLRGIMDECDPSRTKVVFFQPELFRTLKATEILSLFLSHASDNKQSIVLFIEDGDECLIQRETDNMGIISHMLNLADGLIGNMLDIKIVITTNAKKLDMDKALVRPGRLCRIIDINTLDTHSGGKIYKRLTGCDEDVAHGLTLAQVYDLAREKNEQVASE